MTMTANLSTLAAGPAALWQLGGDGAGNARLPRHGGAGVAGGWNVQVAQQAEGDYDDAEAVRRAVRGDARAFERLYRRHVARIHGLCLRLVDGDRAKAEQYTQDAFVRAWEKLASFRGDAQFSTWMHRLTVNLVLGEHRLLKRWVTFDEATADADGGSDAGEAMLGEHPQQRVGERLDLERALARLPKGARAVLMLYDVEGYSHEEIAELSGIAVGTSKAQLHRARKLMKEWLS
ncbi:RNA polymerase sigma factor [Solimonas variicoloris]|uniref:RNA polymerase sigma factor n=1 Tax=Solimonas variicoloris TaxID=254408 RepID=UPI00037F2CAB